MTAKETLMRARELLRQAFAAVPLQSNTVQARSHIRGAINVVNDALIEDGVLSVEGCDVVAFVALDIKTVGYVPIVQLTSKQHGGMVQAVDFYAGAAPGRDSRGRLYVNNGTRRALTGKHLNDYAAFPFNAD